MTDATDALEALLESPAVQVLSPAAQYWGLLREAVADGSARGNLVFDAQIVAVCREHGADTILSEDRDFRRFSGITVLRLEDAATR
jgi:predicted nucleic acid-binding protein